MYNFFFLPFCEFYLNWVFSFCLHSNLYMYIYINYVIYIFCSDSGENKNIGNLNFIESVFILLKNCIYFSKLFI